MKVLTFEVDTEPYSKERDAQIIKLAEENPDAVIVCIICDRGDRYLSTGLFSVQDED